MFSIIGIVVVFGCIAAGYLMEHGNMKALAQPAELIIIGGAALGTALLSHPIHMVMERISGVVGGLRSSKYGAEGFADLVRMMYQLGQSARKKVLAARVPHT